jgi:hypothetical protein
LVETPVATIDERIKACRVHSEHGGDVVQIAGEEVIAVLQVALGLLYRDDAAWPERWDRPVASIAPAAVWYRAQ